MYKNNSRFSSKLKHFGPPRLSCHLKEMKPEIGYNYYTNR
jgi:hypothetical protein